MTEVYAKEIDHVKSVKNEIAVKAEPAPKTTIGEKIDEASITTRIKYALLCHKATNAPKTKATTTDGVIAITRGPPQSPRNRWLPNWRRMFAA